jgi:hypothetical protein
MALRYLLTRPSYKGYLKLEDPDMEERELYERHSDGG